MRAIYPPVVVLCVVACAAACNAVFDIPEAGHLAAADASASSSSSSGTSGQTTSSTSSSSGTVSGNCPTGKKNCNGKCVATNDPQMGCALAACDACAVVNGTAKCDENGNCAVDTCNDPFKDCDQKYPNGCETDTSSDAQNCGDCSNPCESGLTCVKFTCGCDQSVQCALAANGGAGGQVTCMPDTRLCECFGTVCDQGSNCNLDNQDCN